MIKQKIKKIVLILMLSFLLVTSNVSAANYGSIGGRPANPDPLNPRTQDIFVYKLDVNQSKTDGVRVYNNTTEKKTILVYAVDSVRSSDGAFACAQLVDEKKDVGSWIKLEKEEITIDSGKNEEVKFTITVPQNASVGEHNGCIVIQEKEIITRGTKQSNGVNISFRSATRVAITVPGEIKKSLEITNFTVQSVKNENENSNNNNSTSKVKLRILSSIKNNGNVSLDALIKIRISDFLNNPVQEYSNTFPVLRGETLDVGHEFVPSSMGGIYNASLEVIYDSNPKNLLGATENQKLISIFSKQLQFYSEPDSNTVLTSVVVVSIFVIVSVLVSYRFYRKYQIKKTWEKYKVKKGEELPDIAHKFDLKWQELAKANDLRPPYFINPGEELFIPPQNKSK